MVGVVVSVRVLWDWEVVGGGGTDWQGKLKREVTSDGLSSGMRGGGVVLGMGGEGFLPEFVVV